MMRSIPPTLTLLPAILAIVAATGINTAEADVGELRGRVAGVTKGEPAVVWVEGLSTGETPKSDTVITHISGRFQPKVSIGFVGNSFVFRNDDNTLHNTHLYLRLAYQKELSDRPLHYGATLYNVALPKAGAEVRKPIKPYHRYRRETGFIEVVCNPHPEERAHVLVFDHPYAAVTDGDGTFSIPDLPPGRHQVMSWRAGSVKEWGVVEIKDGAVTEIAIAGD